jgi:hypothetical protein
MTEEVGVDVEVEEVEDGEGEVEEELCTSSRETSSESDKISSEDTWIGRFAERERARSLAVRPSGPLDKRGFEMMGDLRWKPALPQVSRWGELSRICLEETERLHDFASSAPT